MTWCQENATEKLSVDLCDTCSCYEMYHWDHTFCTSPDSSVCGTVFARNVEDEDKVTIVNLHNRLRSKIARGEEITFETYPAASNMMQLVSKLVSAILPPIYFSKLKELFLS